MKRREILVASVSSAFVIGGCLGDPQSNGSDTNGVPGCTEKAEWTETIATGPTDPEPESIAGRRDCTNASRPEPTGESCETFVREVEGGTDRTVHSTGVQPYPDAPSAFDEETLRSFVSTYEQAYTQNAAVTKSGENVVEFSFNTSETLAIDRDTITVIVIYFGYGFRVEGDGYTDAFGNVAVYAIDKTGVVRSGKREGPGDFDPDEVTNPVENGDLLECF